MAKSSISGEFIGRTILQGLIEAHIIRKKTYSLRKLRELLNAISVDATDDELICVLLKLVSISDQTNDENKAMFVSEDGEIAFRMGAL